MVVDAVCWLWTAAGMRQSPEGQYIERREVERLLEEAHARGLRQGQQQGEESCAQRT